MRTIRRLVGYGLQKLGWSESARSRSIDETRLSASRKYLHGRGIEIGAGIFPQPVPDGVICECFDIRTKAELATLFGVLERHVPDVYPLSELPKRFPEGADFLIAHNVVEHSPNPINTLIEWHRMVKDGGCIVMSLPDHRFCEDRERLLPNFEHILMDYLFQRNSDSFESREHVYSFMFGWNDSGAFKGMDKVALAVSAHMNANARHNDLHWHAFNRELGLKVVLGAALFDHKSVTVEAVATPDEAGAKRTLGDIIFVYRVWDGVREGCLPRSAQSFVDEVSGIGAKLETARALISSALAWERGSELENQGRKIEENRRPL